MATGNSGEGVDNGGGVLVTQRGAERSTDVESMSLFFFSILCQWLAHDRSRGPVFLWREKVGRENSFYAIWLHLTSAYIFKYTNPS